MPRSSDDYLGRPRSFEEVEALVFALLKALNIKAAPKLNISWLVEHAFSTLFPHAALIPVRKEEMDESFGLTVYKPTLHILLRQDVYIGLNRNHPLARFVAAHEFGHLVMHRDMPKYLKDGAQEKKLLKNASDMSTEQQADYFALVLLIPRQHLKDCVSLSDIVQKFNVPIKLARLAAKMYKLNLKRLQPYQIIALAQEEEAPFTATRRTIKVAARPPWVRKLQPYEKYNLDIEETDGSQSKDGQACFCCGASAVELHRGYQECETCGSTFVCR